MAPLAPSDEDRFSPILEKLDKNGDGVISMEELASAFRDFRLSGGEAEAAALLQRADADGDGSVAFGELAEFLASHEQRLKLVFTSLDADKDGDVTAQEIQSSLIKHGIKLEEGECSRLLAKLDKDNSLAISWQEWRDHMLWQPHSDLQDIVRYWRKSTFLDIGEDFTIPDDFTPNEMKTGMWWRHLVAGGVAGAVSRTSTAPLDRLKVMLQVHGSKHGQKMTVVSVLKNMVAEGGVRSLWRGNGVNVVKIAPESALKFMAYDAFKKRLKGSSERELKPQERMLAGASAGALAQTVIYPMELIKTRLAISKSGQYKGIFDCAMKCAKLEGPKAFYKGYLPNIMGIIPYAGIDLTVYETLKKEYATRHPNEDPGIAVLLLCGTTSSTAGQLASYPLALVRTKMQAASVGGEKLTTRGLITSIVKNEGIRGLYRGIAPNFLKVAPAVSISYVVYENARKRLGVT